jgi:hypothetical protein
MSTEQLMWDQQVNGTPCNLIPALSGCYYHTMTSFVEAETLNSWHPMHHSEIKSDLICLVISRPKLCTIQTMGHGNLGKQCVWNSPILMSSGQPRYVAVPVSVFPRSLLSEKTSTQGRDTFLQCLPLTGLAGLAAIATGQAGVAYGHSQFLVMCVHCDITTKSFLIGQTA